MKNPLRKRLPREFKDEFGKYLVIFLFMTLTIGLVSGFLVAGKSMVKTYNDSFEEYNIEDGHFILNDEITGTLQNKLEDEEDITVYSLFYKEEEEGEHTYRIYKNREDIDGVSVHKGRKISHASRRHGSACSKKKSHVMHPRSCSPLFTL